MNEYFVVQILLLGKIFFPLKTTSRDDIKYLTGGLEVLTHLVPYLGQFEIVSYSDQSF